MDDKSRPDNKRQALLDAAVALITDTGTSNLTLDAIAQRAGVSKGGLLYHFPNKEALIAAMLQDYLTSFTESLELELEQTQDQTPGRWLRAYIRASLTSEQPHPSMISAGLAAMSSAPKLLEPVQACYARWKQRALQDGLDPVTTLLIMQAVEGTWYLEMFGLELADLAEREALIERLIAMTHAD